MLDLARLALFAQRRGEVGVLRHLACFFKNPHGVSGARLLRAVRDAGGVCPGCDGGPVRFWSATCSVALGFFLDGASPTCPVNGHQTRLDPEKNPERRFTSHSRTSRLASDRLALLPFVRRMFLRSHRQRRFPPSASSMARKPLPTGTSSVPVQGAFPCRPTTLIPLDSMPT